MKIVIIGLMIGIAAGMIGALCGVGGGIFMVPMFVTFLGLSQKQAVATSLAVVIFTSVSATISNVRSSQPLIQWPLFFAAATGGIVTSYFIAEKMKLMADDTLTRIFAIVLISAGVWMWFSAPAKAKDAAAPPAASPK
ncbi:MAG TPA: sulfite exporter TauE/SafE family protein [Verrucomicrobiales bacterium]|jgi:hypothetical protein|nr:sulfite exporter TauE/SafE family protein [Verrucomicrobiales bacterium]